MSLKDDSLKVVVQEAQHPHTTQPHCPVCSFMAQPVHKTKPAFHNYAMHESISALVIVTTIQNYTPKEQTLYSSRHLPFLLAQVSNFNSLNASEVRVQTYNDLKIK